MQSIVAKITNDCCKQQIVASSHKLNGCKNSICFDDPRKDIWQQKN